ncbi:YcaO-like family protein [Bacillus sp. P14.5]|uniref:YcaO-like family protein n=1 Tax=Bacillus sp. P14.5 TaxID=1983400 RepID=UPI000DE947FE|nr:YcaO-like family protein [Bacillus sp. P14.5]
MNLTTVQHSRKERTQSAKEVGVLEKASHVFIGPYIKDKMNGCFQCFYHILESNDSNYKEIIDFGPSFAHTSLTESVLREMAPETFVNKVLIINKKTFEFEWKNIRKSPFCKTCSGYLEPAGGESTVFKDSSVYRVKSSQEISNLIEAYQDEIIDWDTGIGKTIFRDAESNIIPMYAIEANIGNRKYYSYGRTVNLTRSRNAAILELLERYSSMLPRFKETIYDSYANLILKGRHVLHPSKYILRHNQVFKEDAGMYWSVCIEQGSGKKVLVPEQMMYFDNQLLRGEERFLYETSNGTALGGTPEEALVYAALEAVERDCFLVHWYTKKLPKLVEQSSIKDPKVKRVLETLYGLGYDIHLFDISLETEIPAIWILIRNQNEDANIHIYNAAGSHYEPEAAIFAALVEAATSIIVYEEKLGKEKEGLKHLIANPEGVRKMEDHVNYYAFKENAGAFDYLLDNLSDLERTTTTAMEPSFPFSFTNILGKILNHHPEIYFCNMPNDLIEEMDLHVVKVFIPTLQPMTFGKQNERINADRLSRYGREKNIFEKEPHPFP